MTGTPNRETWEHKGSAFPGEQTCILNKENTEYINLSEPAQNNPTQAEEGVM